jgi:hypothetical protein
MLVRPRTALLGIVVSSLLSCGAADDDPTDRAPTELTTPAPTPAPPPLPLPTAPLEIAPAAPRAVSLDTFTTTTSPAFTYTEQTTLWDDGYDAPLLSTDDAHYRLESGVWTAAPATRTDWPEGASWTELPLRADFTALGTHAPAADHETFAASVSASLPSGRVYVFGWAGGDLGIAQWSASQGASFARLPTVGEYAVFPNAVLARSDDDVWVAASATSSYRFGPDFPGCPSILLAEQDNGIVAHYDGRTWTALPYLAHAALSSIHAIDDDEAVEIIAGDTFHVTTGGRWTRIESRVAKRAREAGWKVDGGRVLRERAGGWETVDVALPSDRDGRFVPLAVHVVPTRTPEVWIEGQVVTGNESPPYVMPAPMWLRATAP